MTNSNLGSAVLETTTRGTANTRVFAGTHVARYDRSRFGALCDTFVAKVSAIVITFVESRGIHTTTPRRPSPTPLSPPLYMFPVICFILCLLCFIVCLLNFMVCLLKFIGCLINCIVCPLHFIVPVKWYLETQIVLSF